MPSNGLESYSKIIFALLYKNRVNLCKNLSLFCKLVLLLLDVELKLPLFVILSYFLKSLILKIFNFP